MRNMTKASGMGLALVATESVLVEAALAGLAPLLLRSRSATTVATGTTGLHLLGLHLLVVHARTAKAGLLLGKGLSARARSCPRIRL